MCVPAIMDQIEMILILYIGKLKFGRVNNMKEESTIIVVTVLLFIAIVIGWAALTNVPEQKAVQFVNENGSGFSELVDSGQPIPTTFDGVKIYIWSREHLMCEFLLETGMGDSQYWGVYYSPDDVPLPFQNTDVSLLANGEGSWTWRAEEDNHGATKKITKKLYYFEADF